MRKDVSFVCNYFKSLIIPRLPDDLIVAKPFRHGLTDDELYKGMATFREFLYNLLNLIATEKDEIEFESGWCFPSILGDFTTLLLALGTRGRLETTPKIKLTVRSEDLFIPVCPVTEKYQSLTWMSGEKKRELFRFLTDLGLRFEGADFSEEVDFAKTGTFHITSDRNVFFVVGLKLIAEATTNHKNYIKMENLYSTVFLRCHFYSLANTRPKPLKINILEYANGKSKDIKEWITHIDKFLREHGCKMIHNYNGMTFTYTRRNAGVFQGAICSINMNIAGCFLVPGINHLGNPGSIMDTLPDKMADIIKSCTMECEKYNNEQCYRLRKSKTGFAPFTFTHNGIKYVGCRLTGHCQFSFSGKCRFHGFSFDLSDPDVRELTKKWIEMELTV